MARPRKIWTMHRCSRCLEVKQRVFVRRRPDGRGKVYTDGSKSRWNGSICPDCRHKRAAAQAFDLAAYLALKPTNTWPKAERAQWLVVSKLAAKGITVTGIERGASGSMIHYESGGEARRMVVKVVRRVSHGMTFTVSPVAKSQKKADRLAMVFPNRAVKVVEMRAHLKRCSKSGVCTVTELAREAGVKADSPAAAPAAAVTIRPKAPAKAAAERKRA